MGEMDSKLLQRFITERDDAAFEELVRRHGGMVFGVCERILSNPHDAEDAFQATFVVLARNAAKLRKAESVASWLYGIALRVALNARRRAARQREHERRVVEMMPTKVDADQTWQDTKGVLDEEVARMPEKLRAPLVLCYLENKTNEEAAEELGWTGGELRGRLAKGREVLRKRLSQKGVVLGASVLFALISEKAAAATVPQACIASTVKAASMIAAGEALASGVLSAKVASLAAETMKILLWAKVKTAATLIAASAVVFCGTGLALRQAFTTAGDRQVAAKQPSVAPLPAPPKLRLAAEPAGSIVPEPEVAAASPEPEETPLEPIAALEDDLTDAAMNSLMKLYPNAVIVEVKIEEDDDGTLVYEVDLEVDGRECDVELDLDGRVLKIEENIDIAALPEAVAKAVEASYPAAVIQEVTRKTENAEVVYDLDLQTPGEEIELRLSPEGEILEEEVKDAPDVDIVVPVENVGEELF